MKTMLSLRRHRCLARFSSLLIVAALIVGAVGCPPPAVQYELTISSTEGGSVTTPGEGSYTYDEGALVNLVGAPDAGYHFVNWTGDVGTIADVNAVATTITMNGDYSVTAVFAAVHSLTITSTEGGSVTAPGEGSFTYDIGTVVNLVATPDGGYRFADWTGDIATIADVDAATTTISMSGDYSITASFELERTTGPFLDEVLITRESDPSAAVQQLKNGALDVYAFGLNDPALYADVVADPRLTSASSVVLFYEFTFNPVGPTFPATGKLNPFSAPEFREAMHWLIDRDYLAREILGGLAIPRYTCLHSTGADARERYPDLIAALEAKYGHDQVKAEVVVAQEMAKLGAVLDDGKWMYNGEAVELIFLIRTEDERKETGDYFATLLEGQGFTVTRQYGTSRDLLQVWVGGDPALGVWHIYTGAWINSVISRDEDGSFGQFYTSLWSAMGPLWQAYVNNPDFYEAAEKLWTDDYASMVERDELFEICLPKSMEDNVRMFLVTEKRFSPMRNDVRMAADLVRGLSGGYFHRRTGSNAAYATGASGSWVWALTAHLVDSEGDPIVGRTLRVSMPDVLTNPWNPVAGTNSVYDTFPIRATGDNGLQSDTRTGLRWPGRIEKAEVFVETGHVVGVTNTDWCSLTFVPEIQVPLDAWADWDAATQKFLTVQDRFGSGGTTAKTKSVSYYPKDIFEVPLHDGSTLSMGDFILYTILRFDRGKPQSGIYDEGYVAEYDYVMNVFKGVKFITDDPNYGLIVETYCDWWQLDAELVVTTWFPGYSATPFNVYTSYHPGMWHTIALGIKAEEDEVLAFSQSKSSTLGVEWMSFIAGPSLPFLRSYLTSAKAADYIPYEPTMGLYVTEAEAAERWSNLEQWYNSKGHFWVASGPFYLEEADITDKVVHLKRFEDYPDPSDRWLFLLEPLP